MANKKITALPALGATPATDDVLPIVDVSGTATTKKVTVANLVAAAPQGDLVAANNLSDVASAGTSRTNLGLGTAAVANTGTASGNVVVLDGVGLPAINGSQLTNLPSVVSSGTDTNLPSSPSVGDIYLETNTGKLRWWDGTYWNTFNYSSQYDPNYAANQLGYSGGLFSSTNYTISVQPKMHFDAAILDGSDQANNPSSGLAVSTWGDRSGQATSYDGTQATGSAQPTFNVSGDDKYVSFDGGDVLDLANSITRASSQPWTIVQVGNASSSGSIYYAAINETGGGSVQLGKYSDGNIYAYGSTGISGQNLSTLNMLTYSRTGANVLEVHRDGNNSLGTASRSNSFVHEAIGSSGTTKTTGDIYEVIFFDSILSTTDLNTINSYFANKYSSLPTLTSW